MKDAFCNFSIIYRLCAKNQKQVASICFNKLSSPTMSLQNEHLFTRRSYAALVASRIRDMLSNIDWEIKVLLAFVMVIFYSNRILLAFAGVDYGEFDPWVYHGYFVDLKQHLSTFQGAYYGTRLPWILPGSLLCKALPPLVASAVFHLGVYSVTTTSMYQIVKRLINRRTALLTAVLMASYFYFIHSMGSNYIDGGGICYLLLTLLMLTPKQHCERPSPRYVLAGVFYGCLIYTQLFLIVFTPLLAIYYILITKERDLFPTGKALLFIGLGLSGITLTLCLINYLLESYFFFFMPIFRWVTHFVLAGQNPWWIPISSWNKSLFYGLGLPVMMLCVSLFFLVNKKATKSIANKRTLLSLMFIFALAGLLFGVMDFIVHQPVIQWHYYLSYLIPVMFLAVASSLAIAMNHVSNRAFHTITLVVSILSLLPYLKIFNFYLDANHAPVYMSYLTSISVLPIIICFLYFKNFQVSGVLVTLVFLTANNLLSVSKNRNNLLSVSKNSDVKIEKGYYSGVMEGFHFVKKVDPRMNALFWYHYKQNSGIVYRSIASMNLWGYRLINETFPEDPPKDFPPLKPHARIFLMSDEGSAFEQANAVLAQRGLIGKLLKKTTVKCEDVYYDISLIEIDLLSGSL